MAACSAAAATAQAGEPAPRTDITFYRLAEGFQAETFRPDGFAVANGFARPNRWGQYTAYLMARDARGFRTWRIEHYLPVAGQDYAQGSTMYLLEGGDRALLIDTGSRAASTPGVNDLTAVVRHLLATDDRGGRKRRPLDFVVANTHSHPDHVGENPQMADRTVYYMDGDWPADAPPNYVPIREGGGATTHGGGTAVAAIDLGGGRLLTAIAMPPHTPGSIGYLDGRNRMLFSGDALGSAWPFLQMGPLTTYSRSAHHVEEITRPYPDLVVLPAHFYQIRAWGRGDPPLAGRPLDRRYILDQVALADGVLDGSIVGGPFFLRRTYWAGFGSARLVYSLDRLAADGETLPSTYHAVRIPGSFERRWTGMLLAQDQDINRVIDIGADIYLIRQHGGPSLYLIRGTTSALLIGTGTGARGLNTTLQQLIGDLPLDVVLLDAGREQTGGLAQLSPRRIYVADGIAGGTALRDGDRLSLGLDRADRPLLLEAQNFRAGGQTRLTLLALADRLMFAGAALGQTNPGPAHGRSELPARQFDDPETYQVGLNDWGARTTGRYDTLYVSGSSDWYLGPNSVAELGISLSARIIEAGQRHLPNRR
jgi:glyoxylase-like metal-dependent hydrolase (beta-lactamase superfamily II)